MAGKPLLNYAFFVASHALPATRYGLECIGVLAEVEGTKFDGLHAVVPAE